MNSVYNEYDKKVKSYEEIIKKQNKSVSTIGYLRLVTFIIGLAVTYYTFSIKSYFISVGVFVLALGIFIYLIIIHNKEIEKRKYSISLRRINEKALKRLNGEWKSFEDDGNEFKQDSHNYSADLDIFGKSSLFQWINCSKTFMGRQELKDRLTNPLSSVLEIKKTQEALKELSCNLEFRQQFEAEGMMISDKSENPEKLYKWAEEKIELYTKPFLNAVVRILPVITMIAIILSFTVLKNFRCASIAILIQIICLLLGSKERNSSLVDIYKYKTSIKIYYSMISLLSKNDFKCDYLKNLKNKLGAADSGALTAFKKLFDVCDKVSERNNMVYIIINILFLWDYRCIIKLEKWKFKYGSGLKKWLDIIGEIEALNSISNIIYENPSWAIPSVSDGVFKIKADSIGHPLLGDKKVCNTVSMENPKSILLITGSNMSGKSTFLRTIGINLVLSYIGSCVCAKGFECSLMEIYTCMRISDNLENNISSFYAEILRIKMINTRVKENKKVFFLLDELFKGTNSIDRHIGASALIKQLGNNGAAGIVSTHDLELCDLEKEYPKIKNYHFQEYYANNELKFDYKIRNGASVTRNAMYLIKLAGIDIE